MKKYKLVKTYPNSPKIGTIVTSQPWPHENIYISETNDNVRLRHKDEIKDYPEFWEEQDSFGTLETLLERYGNMSLNEFLNKIANK